MKQDMFIIADDFAATQTYSLLIEVNEKGFNFAVLERNAVKVLGSSSTLFSNDNQLKSLADYSSIKVSCLSKNFTFVPEELIKDNDTAIFSTFLQAQKNEEVCSETLVKNEIRNIYALNKNSKQQIASLFNSANIFPQQSSFIKGCLALNTNGVFLNFKSQHFEFLIIENNQLNFYNIFDFANDDEIQYFIMLVAQQKNLDFNQTTVKVSGDIAEHHLIYQRIKTFFPKTTFNNILNEIDFGTEFNEVEKHQYFSLLNLLLCE